MSIGVALHGSRAAIGHAGLRSAVVAENVLGSDTVGFRRRQLEAVVDQNSYIQTRITRNSDRALDAIRLDATSDYANASLKEHYVELLRTGSAFLDGESPLPRMIGQVLSALDDLSNEPSDIYLARNLIDAVKALTNQLKSEAAWIDKLQANVEEEVEVSVAKANDLIDAVYRADRAIGGLRPESLEAARVLDERNHLVTELSKLIGITTVENTDGTIAIYADGIVPIYDRVPRVIEIVRSEAGSSPRTDTGLRIDGVFIDEDYQRPNPVSGKIQALLSVRDKILAVRQDALDVIAANLIVAFSDEEVQDGQRTDWYPGLIVDREYRSNKGTPRIGLARSLDLVDHADDVELIGALLRDGGVSDSANPLLNRNPDGQASFNARFLELADRIRSQSMSFNDETGNERAPLLELVIRAAAELDGQSKMNVERASDARLRFDYVEGRFNSTYGVNLDYEMTTLLEVEQAYQASVKLFAALNAMFDELLRATG